ncbi:ribonuclease H-like YkuK family protein [Niabella sp. CC-SYL272]|uniref:ribonuclease H-like YkuK family protein n=1 Tax=Niabella agricola TaxID=2891571 RepID=UPI001F38F38E|nr:ribonuclease H-like YkuK family protein [Niabella agricola]MCF3112222.1 ribonuclease H-like YkuK family protein [Niabella agricola]
MEQQQWRRFGGTSLSEPVAEEVNKTLIAERKAGHTIQVCLGTDSQVKGAVIEFATVIVFVRKGKGAFLFLRKELLHRKMSIRERMLMEVDKTVQLTLQLSAVFNKHSIAPELHVDINTDAAYKSNAALSEAMGYVSGMGWICRAKPFAFASSSCANKIVQ